MSMSLGSFIRERRQELGLTQEELAERIGATVRQAEVSRLENDRISLPRRERMEHLAAALEVSLGELLVRSGWMAESDDLPDRDPERDIDLISWNGPVPEDIDGMALPELVAMLERISEAQDQVTAASIALEDARKAVTAEMREELGDMLQARGSEVRPGIGVVDDSETPAVFPA
jgi:transcriptional regulator with XRE-family HTH domain